QCRPRLVPLASASVWRASISAVVVGLVVRRAETSGNVISHSSPSAPAGTAMHSRRIGMRRLPRRLVDFRVRDPYDMAQVSRENFAGRVYQKLRRLGTISRWSRSGKCRRGPLETGKVLAYQSAAPAQRACEGEPNAR